MEKGREELNLKLSFFFLPCLQLEEFPCHSIPFSKNTEAASIIYAESNGFNVDVNSVSPHLLAEWYFLL